MGEQKQDRRVVKTKRAIRNALVQLLSEKELEQITVKELADRADINRKTFYNYYNGVHQVIDEIESEIVTACDQAIQEVDFRRDLKHPSVYFEKLTNILNSDLDFYGHLCRMRGNQSLVYKITDLLKKKVRDALLQQLPCDEQQADIIVDYAVTGMIAVYQTWFNSGRSQSIQEISEVLSVLCFSGITGVLGMEL